MPSGSPNHKLKDRIRIDLRVINSTQDRDYCKVVVNLQVSYHRVSYVI